MFCRCEQDGKFVFTASCFWYLAMYTYWHMHFYNYKIYNNWPHMQLG